MTKRGYEKYVHDVIGERNKVEVHYATEEMRLPRRGSFYRGSSWSKEQKQQKLLERMKRGMENVKYNPATGEIVGNRQKVKKRRKRKKKVEVRRKCQNWIIGMPKPS